MKSSGLFSRVKTGEEERDAYAANFLSGRTGWYRSRKYCFSGLHIAFRLIQMSKYEDMSR